MTLIPNCVGFGVPAMISEELIPQFSLEKIGELRDRRQKYRSGSHPAVEFVGHVIACSAVSRRNQGHCSTHIELLMAISSVFEVIVRARSWLARRGPLDLKHFLAIIADSPHTILVSAYGFCIPQSMYRPLWSARLSGGARHMGKC